MNCIKKFLTAIFFCATAPMSWGQSKISADTGLNGDDGLVTETNITNEDNVIQKNLGEVPLVPEPGTISLVVMGTTGLLVTLFRMRRR